MIKISPISQTKLYGHEESFRHIINLFNKNKLPNKILFSGSKGIGKSTMAFHLINFIFSKNEDNPYNLDILTISELNRSYKLLSKSSHPNFYLLDLIDDNKNIEISQIRKMIEYTNKSSFNNSPRIILIDNLEYLNKNSSNALLKVIEEPNDNVFFILIHNNSKHLSSTLKSRCLNFKLYIDYKESINIMNKLFDKDISNDLNSDLFNYYTTPRDFIEMNNLFESLNIKIEDYNLEKLIVYLISNNIYKKNDYIKKNIFKFIELFLFKKITQSSFSDYIYNLHSKFIKKINNSIRFNLDPESILIEFKSKMLNE